MPLAHISVLIISFLINKSRERHCCKTFQQVVSSPSAMMAMWCVSRTPVSRPSFGYGKDDHFVGHPSSQFSIAPRSDHMAMVSASAGNHVFCTSRLPTITLYVAQFVLSLPQPPRYGAKCELAQRFSPLNNLLRYILNAPM